MNSDNPLYKAPACISQLHGVDRTRALHARDKAAREAWKARYRDPAPRRSLVERVLAGLLG
jgi:hypothetical protein